MADDLGVTEGAGPKKVRTLEKATNKHTGVTQIDLGTSSSEALLTAGQKVAASSIPVVLASDQISSGTLGDAMANPTTAVVGAVLLSYNGTAIARINSTRADADTASGTLPATLNLFNGNSYDRARGDITNGLDVDVTRMPAVAGPVAVDAPVSGNPVLMGAEARTTNANAVGDGDAVRAMADSGGRLVTKPYAPGELAFQYHATLTSSGEATVLAAAGANRRICVTDFMVTNKHSTNDCVVELRDGASGTAIAGGFTKALGGGFAFNYLMPRRGSANQSMVVNLSAGSDVVVTVGGYITQ